MSFLYLKSVESEILSNKFKRLLFFIAGFFLLFSLEGCQLPGFMSKGRSSTPQIVDNPCVVLALPADGPYAPFAQKIKKGAGLAQEQLALTGIKLTIENVNTEAPNWIASLEALPEACAVVGGPLQNKSYVAARKAGILDRRVFFSFAPTIQQTDEGKKAWRFFPSPQDQIDALVKFVTEDLNIRTFGSFYPTDSYGPRMSDLLEKSLAQKHITLQKASYNPAAPATWSSAIQPLINPVRSSYGKIPVPQTMFEALFLPDSWKQMDMITTSLMYNGEDRLALLGTTLWEQGLSGKQIPKAARYALAVFPGAYSKERAPKKIQENGNDFWVALGYDFINFAVNTGIVSRLEAQDINARARSSASAIRAMAPIEWDGNGLAHQKLYLFQVGSNGMQLLNPEQYKQSRQAIVEQAALRMQGLNLAPHDDTGVIDAAPVAQEIQPGISDNSSAPAPAPVEPAPPIAAPESSGLTRSAPHLPQNQIMRSSPQPSYKLRLPNRP